MIKIKNIWCRFSSKHLNQEKLMSYIITIVIFSAMEKAIQHTFGMSNKQTAFMTLSFIMILLISAFFRIIIAYIVKYFRLIKTKKIGKELDEFIGEDTG